MNALTLEAAEALARQAHDRQCDKVGMPYFETHVQDVQRRVAAAGGDEDQQIAALLHDVLEDTDTTEADLRAAGISDVAMRVVRLMTKVEGEDDAVYLARIRADPAALVVKLADIASNTDPVRLARLDPVARRRALTKYIGYVEALGGDASALRTAADAVPDDETEQEREERIERVFEDRLAARLNQMVDEDSFVSHEDVKRELGL
jgi:(p)ppGpp synthase/HD superfamily hydrolase